MADGRGGAGGFTRGAASLPLCKWATSSSWKRLRRDRARNEFANLPLSPRARPSYSKRPFFQGKSVKNGGRANGQMLNHVCPLGSPLHRTRWNLAEASLAEVAVDFDARNTVPREFDQLIERDKSPLIEGQARDISESNALFWIVLRDVPSTGSGNIKKLCQDARIFLAILGVQWIASG